MTEKNKLKQEQKERHKAQNFCGCRPKRETLKTAYSRKGRRKEVI